MDIKNALKMLYTFLLPYKNFSHELIIKYRIIPKKKEKIRDLI